MRVWGEPPVPTLQAAESPLDTHSPRDGEASAVTAVGTRLQATLSGSPPGPQFFPAQTTSHLHLTAGLGGLRAESSARYQPPRPRAEPGTDGHESEAQGGRWEAPSAPSSREGGAVSTTGRAHTDAGAVGAGARAPASESMGHPGVTRRGVSKQARPSWSTLLCPLNDALVPPRGHSTAPRTGSSQVTARGPRGQADPGGRGRSQRSGGLLSPSLGGCREVHAASHTWRPPLRPLGRSRSPGRPRPERPSRKTAHCRPGARGRALTSHPSASELRNRDSQSGHLGHSPCLAEPRGDHTAHVCQAPVPCL